MWTKKFRDTNRIGVMGQRTAFYSLRSFLDRRTNKKRLKDEHYIGVSVCVCVFCWLRDNVFKYAKERALTS